MVAYIIRMHHFRAMNVSYSLVAVKILHCISENLWIRITKDIKMHLLGTINVCT